MSLQMEREAFDARFAQRAEELKWLYMELYHNDQQAWDYFTGMLRRAWEARREELRERDRAREADPDWYRRRGLTGMQISVKQFAGTLQGVREKLDYIRECGVNLLHLLPVMESPEGKSDGGYAVSDYRKVQPELGTTEDLEALAAACREQGIALCLDFVLNHTSDEHEWARRARAGEAEYQRRYFFYDNRDLPNWYEQTIEPVFPVTAPGSFTWCEEAGKTVMTLFHPYQWDLNYANPVVFNDMTENLLYLCNLGADIIRLDALPYVWKAPGTVCKDLPQVHSIARMLRLICEIVCPGTALLGEAVTEHGRVAAYFGTEERPECHLVYNAAGMAAIWHTAATRDVRLMNHELEEMGRLPKRFTFLNYLRCHDDITWTLDWAHLLWNYGWAEKPHKQYLNDYLTGKFPGSRARGETYNEDPRTGTPGCAARPLPCAGLRRPGRKAERGIWKKRSGWTERCTRCCLPSAACRCSAAGTRSPGRTITPGMTIRRRRGTAAGCTGEKRTGPKRKSGRTRAVRKDRYSRRSAGWRPSG